METTRNKIITAAVILFVLVAAFWWGGNSPGLRGWSVGPPTEDRTSSPPENSSTSIAEPLNSGENSLPEDRTSST